MKKILLFLSVALLLLLSGCKNSVFDNFREIEDIELVRTVGVDTDPAGVLLSAAGEEPRIAAAPSVAEAVHRLEHASTETDAYFSHTEHIVVGESAAENGLEPVLDYTARAMKMRIDTNMFLAPSAAELMSRDATEALTAIVRDAPELGLGAMFTCRDMMQELAETGCALIQAVELSENEKIVPCGFGVLIDGKLRDRISSEEARGVCILRNLLDGCFFSVASENGGSGLLLTECKTEVVPEYADGLSGVTLHIRARFNIAQTAADIENADVRAELSQSVSDALRYSAEAAVFHAQTLGCDYLDIGGRVYAEKPFLYRANGVNWCEAFPKLPITVEAEAEPVRAYDMGNPENTTGGENAENR